MSKAASKKNAQDIQDEIFRNMSTEKKLELGAQLWRLAMAISGKKMKAEELEILRREKEALAELKKHKSKGKSGSQILRELNA